MKKKLLLLLLILLISNLTAIDWSLNHYISLNGRYYEEKVDQNYLVRALYQPDFSFTFWQKDFIKVDMQYIVNFELSFDEYFNEYGTYNNSEFNAESYRLWFRYSAEQYEIRLGQQQLNFGPATLLRTLKWFDNIDPKDPSRKTDGVNALLIKKYFVNNANIWLWIVDPNEPSIYIDELGADTSTKGYQYGGRIQYPFKYCETALSYLYRTFNSFYYNEEHRIGFDCRWDFEIGLWLETMYSTIDNIYTTNYTNLLTIGADYTIPFGNGIYLLAEHMFNENSVDKVPSLFHDSSASSFIISYPIGLFDSIKGITTYNWQEEVTSYFLSYNRNYNYFSIYLNLYLNPYSEDVPMTSRLDEGRSVELMLETKF